MFLPATAGAVTYVVDTDGSGNAGACTAAAGDCTLPDAIDTANSNTGGDTISFALSSVVLDEPLPAVTDPVTINGFPTAVTVSGSPAYATNCTPGLYAFDLTDSGAVPSSVRGLPIYDVCNRAIKSNVAPPTIKVGPRRFDNTVSINGQAAAGATVDVFAADGPDTGSNEGDDFLATVSAPAGGYSYTPGSEPVAGQKFTAVQYNGSGGSNFATRAETPSDLTSPTLLRAVAVSNSGVRLDFNEPIAPASAVPSAFTLSVASIPRAIASATASGSSVFLESSVPWLTGEAGSAVLSGTVRVTDAVGNEALGQPAVEVNAGPGEAVLPQITSMRLSPNRFCKKVTRRCRRGSSAVLIAVNKPARVIFEVRRGGKRSRTMVTFVRRLDAGRNRVKLSGVVSGKQLPATILALRATAQDVARSLSPPVEAVFRVVTDKSKL